MMTDPAVRGKIDETLHINKIVQRSQEQSPKYPFHLLANHGLGKAELLQSLSV